jgi:hypothetical protein
MTSPAKLPEIGLCGCKRRGSADRPRQHIFMHAHGCIEYALDLTFAGTVAFQVRIHILPFLTFNASRARTALIAMRRRAALVNRRARLSPPCLPHSRNCALVGLLLGIVRS